MARIGLILLTLAILQSCVLRKNVVYFQGQNEIQNTNYKSNPLLEVGDIVAVEVTSTDATVAAPYNQAEIWRQGNQNTSYDNGVPATFGYLVHPDSLIYLPVIGPVKLGGMSRDSAVATIQNILKDHLESPQVSIRILNFKVTVLGEVNNPGTFAVPNERINVLEAIGVAKDLKITGKRKNVLVIRNEQGKTVEYRLDLTSKELFKSPAFMLKQNDVVYVEPNLKARYDASILRTTGGFIISATSLIIGTYFIIK